LLKKIQDTLGAPGRNSKLRTEAKFPLNVQEPAYEPDEGYILSGKGRFSNPDPLLE
jgi:hypothetical protein